MVARSQGIWWDSLTRADGLVLGGLLAAIRFQIEEHGGQRWLSRSALAAIRLAGLGAFALICVLGIRIGLARRGHCSVIRC